MREVRSVRERDTQRERERERESETEVTSSVALKLAKKFALFLAKNLHLSFSPLKWRWVHTFRCQNVALFETVRILRKIRTLRDRLNYLCLMAWQGMEAPKQTIEFPAAPSFFSSKKWIKLIPKIIGNRKKRLCARLHSGDKHHLRTSADRKAQIRKAFVPLTGLIRAFRSADFLRWCLSPECNLTHNLFFLFPIIFGINFYLNPTG